MKAETILQDLEWLDETCTVDTTCSFDPNQVVDPSDTTVAGLYHTHPFGGDLTYPNDYADAYKLQVPTFAGTPQGTMYWYEPPSLLAV